MSILCWGLQSWTQHSTVKSHENGGEGQIHLSQPAHSSSDAAQDADNGILMTDKNDLWMIEGPVGMNDTNLIVGGKA